jgi:hypothetical protein
MIKDARQDFDFGVTLFELLTSMLQRDYIMFAPNTFGDKQ